MSIDPAAFRSVLGRFASGVTVVTTLDQKGRDCGMTVSAFSSVSLDPPLILICIGHDASIFEVISSARTFAVNILSQEQEAISRRFAEREIDRFDGLGYSRGTMGLALLDDTLAWLECETVARHEAGDHLIIIGRVESAAARDMRPLLYYRGGYAELER